MAEPGLREVFLEESREIMESLENDILILEEQYDKEVINNIFRHVHTLKGSSGVAGFNTVYEFTHHLEGLLDLVRSEHITINPEIIDVLLKSLDWTKQAIFGTPDEEESEKIKDALSGQIAVIIESVATRKSAPGRPAGKSQTRATKGTRYYRILMKFRDDIFSFGIDPLIILEDLAAQGELIELVVDRGRLFEIEEYDPEKCYISWRTILESTRPLEEIESVFLFVKDDNQIQIEDVTNQYTGDASLLQDRKLGEILVERGVITEDVLDEMIDLQSQENFKLGDLIVEKGLASEQEIGHALSEQERIRKRIEIGTVRVATSKLDALMNLLGEIVIGQSGLARLADGLDEEDSFQFKNSLYSLDRITREFQQLIMSIRMIPIGPTFEQFRRFVRDMGNELEKKIKLEIRGEDTELDKTVIEKIADPLKHMIRNAIDHGIEKSEVRQQAGKDEVGRILLNAYHQEGSVFIEVSDDGAGISRERIREKAEQLGLLTPGEPVSDQKLLSVVFEPGFSTAQKVGDLSGRGVGMDVVRTNIEALRGTVEIRSEEGQGTMIQIKMPLTLAIIDGMLVRVGENIYIVPLLSIIESLQPKPENIKTIEGKGEVVLVRGEYVSLVRLYDYLQVRSDYTDPTQCLVVIVESGNDRIGLMVDDLIGQHQTVIKNLNSGITNSRAITGAAILGDGRIALILDIHGLVGEISLR